MKLQLTLVTAAVMISSTAFAKKPATDKDGLIKSMVAACKTELGQDPKPKSMTDGQMVWRNLEDKEDKMKLSPGCHEAHEKYEAKYVPEHHEEDEKKSESK